MLTSYVKLALRVLLRRKFYTAVSLFGIAFTLVILVVSVAVIDEQLFGGYPELRSNRFLGIYYTKLAGPESIYDSGVGYALLDRCARDLPGVETFAIASWPRTVPSYLRGELRELELRATDGNYWEVMDFEFVAGGPFTAADDASGNFLAVINERTAEDFFGGEPAVGREIRADGQTFNVIGVVRDVSRHRFHTFAEIWVPIGTAKSTSYRGDLAGDFIGILLAESRAAFPEIRAEFVRRVAEIELPDSQFDTVESMATTLLEEQARHDRGVGTTQGMSFLATRLLLAVGCGLLIMALPALNLVNLNLSRILERSGEIGLRKAFGATSRALVAQFLVESVVLTLIGGLVGLVLAEIGLLVVNRSGLVPYAALHVNYRVFACGLLMSVVFGLLSGAYPAWRISRLHPVQALRGRV